MVTMDTNTCLYPLQDVVFSILRSHFLYHYSDIIDLLLGSIHVLTLSLYNIIYAVESVDAWRPDINLYESGEIASSTQCFCSKTIYFARRSSVLTVSTNQARLSMEKHLGPC